MKRLTDDIVAMVVIILFVVGYFFRLFYPQPQLIVTPDFGRSDAWHFSFPTKYALSQALQHNTLPTWRSDLGSGFPLLAEGQTGTFFLPNLILFRLFDPVTAYNLALTFAIVTLGFGMYFLSKTFGFKTLSSLFAAITFMFSGLSFLQLPHITLLQGMSLLPILMICALNLLTKKSLFWSGLYALILSQQLFAGFPQSVFLTLIFVGIITIHHVFIARTITPIVLITCATLLGILGGMVQLLPSYEFLKESTNPIGFSPRVASSFSMPLVHLKTFIQPFAFGNPKYGTYPSFTQFDGSIFWENTAYIGILPIILLFFLLRSWKKKPLTRTFFFVTFFSLLFAWGKHSPIYIFYAIWPFTLFRVPSRFLWLTILSLALLSAQALSQIEQKPRFRFVIFIIILLHGIHLLTIWWSYHLILPASMLTMQSPATQLDQDRILTIGDGTKHNEFFLSEGWENPSLYASLYTLAPTANSNILSGHSQNSVYAGRFLQRSSLFETLLKGQLTTDAKNATFSATTFLTLSGVTSIYSYVPVHSNNLMFTGTIEDPPITVYTYRNPDALSRAYIASDIVLADTLASASSLLRSPEFVPGRSVLLETHESRNNVDIQNLLNRNNQRHANNAATITVHESSMTDITVTISNNTHDAMLVLSDTAYPGWKATIDNVNTTILTANLAYKAVYIPSGDHVVRFQYRPRSIMWGMVISFVTHIFIGFLIMTPILFYPGCRDVITHLLLLRHRYTNDT